MVRLACEGDARFEASAIDAPHPDGSMNYTVDTLAKLRHELPQAIVFAIAGADSFLTLRQWREPDRLLELAEWIVVSRPGFPLNNLVSLNLTAEQRDRVHLVETLHEDISATELRQQLEARENCGDWLPQAVAAYIAEHRLYR